MSKLFDLVKNESKINLARKVLQLIDELNEVEEENNKLTSDLNYKTGPLEQEIKVLRRHMTEEQKKMADQELGALRNIAFA